MKRAIRTWLTGLPLKAGPLPSVLCKLMLPACKNSDFKLDGHTVDLHFMVNDFFMPLGPTLLWNLLIMQGAQLSLGNL